MTATDQPSFREKISFGLGDFASVLYWQTFMLYLMYFYTDVFGISAAVAGTMMLVSRFLDAITDPTVGMIADRTRTRWGRFRPYLIWFCVPFALIGVLTFTTPELGDTGKIVWAYVTYNALMLLYTIINIPYTALMGVLSSDATQRTSISSIKFVCAFGAGSVIGALLLPMVIILGGGKKLVYTDLAKVVMQQGVEIEAATPDGWTPLTIVEYADQFAALEALKEPLAAAKAAETLGMTPLHVALYLGDLGETQRLIAQGADAQARTASGLTSLHLVSLSNVGLEREVAKNEQRGWQLAFVVIGLIAVLCFVIAFSGTKERVQPVVEKRNSVGSDLKDLLQNKPWLILLASTITFILFVATRSTVTVHYFKYFVGTQDVILPFGLMNGRYSFEILVSVFNTIGQISSILGVIALPFITKYLGKKKTFTIMGIVALISTGSFFLISSDQVGLMLVMQIFGSLTGGPLSALMWAMYADTADYGEWKTGRRATGLVFSASTMSQKFGWAIGGGIAGWMLHTLGFEANMIPTPEVMDGLRVMMSLIPAGVGVLFVAIIFFYPLDEKKVSEIQADLAARRKLQS